MHQINRHKKCCKWKPLTNSPNSSFVQKEPDCWIEAPTATKDIPLFKSVIHTEQGCVCYCDHKPKNKTTLTIHLALKKVFGLVTCGKQTGNHVFVTLPGILLKPHGLKSVYVIRCP